MRTLHCFLLEFAKNLSDRTKRGVGFGPKRTSAPALAMSANDPQPTYMAVTDCKGNILLARETSWLGKRRRGDHRQLSFVRAGLSKNQVVSS